MIERSKLRLAIAWAVISAVCNCASGEQFLKASDLKVLDQPARTMMSNYLTAIVDEQFAKRAALLGSLKTAEDWGRHSEFVRKSMAKWTGPLPERTPLRACITGRINRDKYTLEKILFESRPNFLVSANLYLPKGSSSRRPAVLNVIGHSPAGKATDKVQRRAIAQAQKGFVALVVDCQGERQVADYAFVHSPPGNAHQVVGTQAFIAGTHVFNFMLWDVIRAADYLVSRPEVDPKRIACTGCSGGGMMTTYILAFETRITVAVPACNPCTWSHRVHANLSTDHEQVFFGAFESGIDLRGDPLFCQVPKPLLINATSDDNLNPPSGVWDLSTWLYKAYSARGEPHKFQTSMVKAPHGYNQEQREVAYAWMLKWLGGNASDFREGDFAVEKEEDTWCTPAGNVYGQPRSRSPHDLVLEHLEAHRSGQDIAKSQLRTSIKKVLGLKDSIAKPQGEVGRVGLAPPRVTGGASPTLQVKITPTVIRPEDGIVLPAVWVESPEANADGPVIIYLNDKGKAELTANNAIVRALLERGCRIFAVDLRGQGETSPDMKEKFWDFLAGRPIFGQRVADVRMAVRWCRSRSDNRDVYLWARGVSAIYAALAATLEDGIAGIVSEEPLLTFEQIVTTKVPAYRHEIILPGVLEHFDLPQVYQALAPMKLTLINPLAGDRSPASQEQAEHVYKQVSKAYTGSGKSDNWSVHINIDDAARSSTVLSALK
ncbi:MAG: alpha/beta hydrolase family protein [Planctomycetota bacterium]